MRSRVILLPLFSLLTLTLVGLGRPRTVSCRPPGGPSSHRLPRLNPWVVPLTTMWLTTRSGRLWIQPSKWTRSIWTWRSLMWLTSPSGMPLKLPWMSISAGPHWRHSLPMPTSSFCLSCLNALVEPLRQSLNYGLLNCSQALSARRLWQMLVPVSPFQPAMWGILLTSVMRCLGASLSPNALRRSSGGGDFTGESFSSLLDTVYGAELRCTSGSAQPKPPPSSHVASVHTTDMNHICNGHENNLNSC